MLVIVDYGVGNLFSLRSSFAALGINAVVSSNISDVENAEKLVLPGVGAFGDAAQKLEKTGLAQAVKNAAGAGTTLLGICLGMQLFFCESSEFGLHKGLGLINGSIKPLKPALEKAGFSYKVPHMGWNPLEIKKQGCPLLKNTAEGSAVYYVHSFYAADCEESTAACSEYGVMVPGVVQNGNVYGTQFHPEKSGKIGLEILKAFTEV